MGEILSVAAAMLSQSQARVESAGRNIANMNTHGYKSEVVFSQLVENNSGTRELPSLKTVHEFSQGKYVISSVPYDLAIEGRGFFVMRDGDAMIYSRNGAFRREGDHLVDARGSVLQAEGGGDLTLDDGKFQILSDGTMLRDGAAAARVAVVDFEDKSVLVAKAGDAFTAPPGSAQALDAPVVRQGMTETSNVSTGDEMVKMMAALRGAETGQHLVQMYDDLMGRVLTTFGGNG